jgi:hypothetical protein
MEADFAGPVRRIAGSGSTEMVLPAGGVLSVGTKSVSVDDRASALQRGCLDRHPGHLL